MVSKLEEVVDDGGGVEGLVFDFFEYFVVRIVFVCVVE